VLGTPVSPRKPGSLLAQDRFIKETIIAIIGFYKLQRWPRAVEDWPEIRTHNESRLVVVFVASLQTADRPCRPLHLSALDAARLGAWSASPLIQGFSRYRDSPHQTFLSLRSTPQELNGNRLPENEWKSISIRIDPAIQLSAASICMLFATPSK